MIVDVIIIGAGASGLMCAIEAGKRGRSVLLLEGANKPGKKILMSGGGRCNFTNLGIHPDAYISHNPHFCKSALSRYTQWNFIDMVEKHHIPFYEKTLGQLFCKHKSKDILNMLLKECEDACVKLNLNEAISSVKQISNDGFAVKTQHMTYQCQSLVVASGGLSIPTLGASPLGYKIAEQFGLKVWPISAALVPFTLHKNDLKRFHELPGTSQSCHASCKATRFNENLLFTHRGLSGPAMLQLSSYWQPGEEIEIDLLPELDFVNWLENQINATNVKLKNCLSHLMPTKIINAIIPDHLQNTKIKELSKESKFIVAQTLKAFKIKPNGTEGYRTAEVTKGGVDCNELSSKTMQANKVPGLYFIGEVVDVTGWLGGYNFQWAWSSGWAAGQAV